MPRQTQEKKAQGETKKTTVVAIAAKAAASTPMVAESAKITKAKSRSKTPVHQEQKLEVVPIAATKTKKVTSQRLTPQQKLQAENLINAFPPPTPTFVPKQVEEESKQMTNSTVQGQKTKSQCKKKAASVDANKKKAPKAAQEPQEVCDSLPTETEPELDYVTEPQGYLGPLPKRPCSNYMTFCIAHAKKIAVEEPSTTMLDRTTMSGKKWNEMTEAEKEPYNKLAVENKERFAEQIKERNQKGYFTLEDQSLSTDLKNMHFFKPKNYRHDKETQRMPMKGGSVYNFFFTEETKKIRVENENMMIAEGGNNVAKLSNVEVFKLSAQRWANISEEDRQPYEKRVMEERARFEVQMGELHQFGFFTLLDGSRSNEEKNRPVLNKRLAKSVEKDAAQKAANVAKKSLSPVKQNKLEQDLTEKVGKKRKAKAPLEETKMAN